MKTKPKQRDQCCPHGIPIEDAGMCSKCVRDALHVANEMRWANRVARLNRQHRRDVAELVGAVDYAMTHGFDRLSLEKALQMEALLARHRNPTAKP